MWAVLAAANGGREALRYAGGLHNVAQFDRLEAGDDAVPSARVKGSDAVGFLPVAVGTLPGGDGLASTATNLRGLARIGVYA
jgi:hypothetical protein